MQEVLVEIAGRMKDAPETITSLTLARAETSDALHRALEEARRIETAVAGEVAAVTFDGRPKYGNEAARNAEVQRRLAAEQAYQRVQTETVRLREELRRLDAELELAKSRFKADNNLVFLAACFVQANRVEMAKAVLAAYRKRDIPQDSPAGEETSPQDSPVKEEPLRQADGLETGVFTVLEARATATGAISPLNPNIFAKWKENITARFWFRLVRVRAYCQAEDGGKAAVFGRNGTGSALINAVGKQVKVKYRRGDKGLIAVDVRPT